MQSARRIVTRSTASLPSTSNTALQTRKRSRTSSAGGDCADVRKKPKTIPNVSDSKGKARQAKNVGRSAPKPAKTPAKFPKGKSTKPMPDNFQNTIVLAPFHTLKRNFQNKLIDLYSREKVKKIDHKIKMAKKQNMTFAYDVMELKGLNKKRPKKGKKIPQKKNVKKDVQQRNTKCKTSNYCQCSKKTTKPKMAAKKKKTTPQKHRNLRSSKIGQLSLTIEESKSKKSKLDDKILASTLYADLGLGLGEKFSSFRLSESNARLSDLTSQSGADSWETLSDSPGGECIKGALAVSTTSFDSCLEAPKKRKQRYGSKLKVVKEVQKDNETSFLMKPKADQSKQQIGPKASDDQIVDFMDREPQTRTLSPTGASEHLQPLRGHRKPTKKKPKESDAPKLYRLRSTRSVQNEVLKNASTVQESKRQIDELPSPVEETTEVLGETKQYHVVVESEMLTNVSRSESPKKKENQSTDLISQAQTESSGPEGSDFKMKDMTSNSEIKFEPSTETIELFHCGNEKDNQSTEIEIEKSLETLEKEKAGQAEEYLQQPELPVEEQKPLQQTTLRSGFPQPEDKVSDFIFGTGNSTARLGESCEFPFGLNWNFSDEEDSNHGGHFF